MRPDTRLPRFGTVAVYQVHQQPAVALDAGDRVVPAADGQNPDVAGLAPAANVEGRAVEGYPRIRHAGHDGVEFLQIAMLVKQQFSHVARSVGGIIAEGKSPSPPGRGLEPALSLSKG